MSALANVLNILHHLPAVVDMDHWSLHTDIALLILLAAKAPQTLISDTIRIQMAVFYAAAGAWKLTQDHMDPRLSCSSLLLVQLLCGWMPAQLVTPPLVAFVTAHAPHITLLAECGIPVLLVAKPPVCRRLGCVLAIALHVGIMMAPLPLSIADFGAMSCSRLLWVVPEAATIAIAEASPDHLPPDLRSVRVRSPPKVAAFGAGLVAAVGGTVCAVHGSYERIVANVAFSALAVVLLRALFIDMRHLPATSEGVNSVDPNAGRDPQRVQARLSSSLIGLATFYAFGMPMLGLIDVGGSTMFSHIKLHGGNSHLLLPTGLLQTALAPYTPSQAHAVLPAGVGVLVRDFAGGVIRVEQSTSAYLNGFYPGETLSIEPEPLVREVLRAAGHEARLFTHQGVRQPNIRGKNPSVGGGLVHLGLGLNFVQDANGAHGRPFTRFTLPAFELRMMLEGMRAVNETFTLELTRIRGTAPGHDHEAAEVWRARGCGTRMWLKEATEHGARVRTCYALDTCSAIELPTAMGDLLGTMAQRRPCDEDELELLTWSPGWHARKLLLSNPYPLLEPAGRYCGSSG